MQHWSELPPEIGLVENLPPSFADLCQNESLLIGEVVEEFDQEFVVAPHLVPMYKSDKSINIDS